jgi:hypothetical protein
MQEFAARNSDCSATIAGAGLDSEISIPESGRQQARCSGAVRPASDRAAADRRLRRAAVCGIIDAHAGTGMAMSEIESLAQLDGYPFEVVMRTWPAG